MNFIICVNWISYSSNCGNYLGNFTRDLIYQTSCWRNIRLSSEYYIFKIKKTPTNVGVFFTISLLSKINTGSSFTLIQKQGEFRKYMICYEVGNNL